MAGEKFYLNAGQRYIYEILPRRLTLIAARRFGKTDGVQGPYLSRVVTYMPRGKSAIYCATLKQGLTRTVPGTLAAIERITGWRNGVHFFVGRKAPKECQFDEPFVKPLNWEHCIHWFNGHVTHILSQDIKFSANSLTLDAVLIDETRIIKKQKVDEELMPAVSGTPGQFVYCPLKKSVWITTDRPITREGQWVLDRESDATPEVEKEIVEMIRERAYLIEKGVPKKYIDAYMVAINKARFNCHLYKEYDTIENIAIVGEDYIADMKRSLPPKIFNISILNKRIKKASDGFYSAFDENRHTYMPDEPDLEKFRINVKPTPGSLIKSSYNTYDFKRLQEHSCHLDTDIDPNQSLNIALDYNANINWIVTGQKGELNGIKTMFCLSSMFVMNERKLPELLYDWCNYYDPHRLQCNQVNFYYNQTAKQKRYANNNPDQKFHETVTDYLRSRGWVVNAIDMGDAVSHQEKFYMLDDALKLRTDPLRGGQKYLFPMLNKENNEFLIAAIENTETTDKYSGFGKDKSGEKKSESEDPNTPEGNLALRTDGTDAFDDLFIGMNRFYKEGSLIFPGISII